MGRPKKRHETKEAAEKEANRLAKEHPSHDVFILGVVGVVEATEEKKDPVKVEPVKPVVVIKKRKVLQMDKSEGK